MSNQIHMNVIALMVEMGIIVKEDEIQTFMLTRTT